jgi:hypothetical protein
MTNNTPVSVKYYQPLYYGNSRQGSGWYFVIPACDTDGDGDIVTGTFSCKEACAAAIRGLTDTIIHHNDNVEAGDVS